jgi:Fur family ferric uptake transcriptional regulator
MKILENLLREHGLKSTPTRLAVISLFQNEKKVWSNASLLKKLGNDFDRVTLYRILTSFEESGIIHKIPDSNGNPSYALCHHQDHSHNHEDHHVHFKCLKCELVTCLDIPFPEVRIPSEMRAIKHNYLIEGYCNQCKES